MRKLLFWLYTHGRSVVDTADEVTDISLSTSCQPPHSPKVLDTWNLILETWYLILEAWLLKLDTWSSILEARYLKLDTWNLILEIWNLILEPWYSITYPSSLKVSPSTSCRPASRSSQRTVESDSLEESPKLQMKEQILKWAEFWGLGVPCVHTCEKIGILKWAVVWGLTMWIGILKLESNFLEESPTMLVSPKFSKYGSGWKNQNPPDFEICS